MNSPATVVSLVGQAWAQAADGMRRELRVGDRLRGDEMLVTAPGARLDLDFGDNRILSLVGEQSIPLTTVVPEASVQELAMQPAAPVQPGAQARSAQDDGPVPEGHNFVQLVRIAEIIEADGITPLTVARIQELLRPLGMSLPDRAFEPDEWREHRGGDRHEHGPAARNPGLAIELQGAGSDGLYSAEEIGPDGTVPALIMLDDKVREGDILVVRDGNGNELLNRPVTAQDLVNGVPVEVPVSPGQSQVVVEATVTTPSGASGSANDDKPVDNLPPDTLQIADRNDLDADPVSLDLSAYFSDASQLTFSADGLPDGLSLDPATGSITGTLDNSASQGGTGGQYQVTVTATDAAGNSTSQSFTWTVGNPPPVASDDSASTAEDIPVDGNVLGNDSDPDGDDLSVVQFVVTGDGTLYSAGQIANIPGVGDLQLNANGSYTFTPAPDWNGTVPSVTYTISDGEGGTDTAELAIVVTPVNDAPVAPAPASPLDQTNLDADDVTAVTLDLPNLFSDVDGDTLSYSIAGLPPGLNFDPATGSITGTLDNSASQGGPDSDGVYSVTLTATDPDGEPATQTFTWTVSNPAPVANPDSGSVTEDGPDLVVSVADGVLQSVAAPAGADTDPDGDTLSVTHVIAGTAGGIGDFSGPGNAGTTITGSFGQLTLNTDGSYTYALDNTDAQVNALQTGDTLSDVFSYAISDGEGGTAWTTLSITIVGADDGVTVSVPTDHDATTPDGNTGDQVVFESGLTNGSSPSPNDTVVNASFTVSALDGLDDSDAVTIDYTDASGGPASLTLSKAQVEALGGAPQSIITRYGTLELNGYSLGGDGVITLDYRYTLVNAPEVSGDHTSDTFAITATDRGGDDHSQNLAIRIVDDAPQAVDDVNGVTEGAAAPVTGALIDGTAGAGQDTQGADGATVSKIVAGSDDSLPGSAPTVAGIDVTGQYGTLTIHADGSYNYQLDNANLAVQGLIEGESLDEVFTYTLTDADGDESVATLTITIAGADDGVTVSVPTDHDATTPDGNTGDQVVFESGLTNGSSPSPNDTVVNASFTVSALDGLDDSDAVTIDYTDASGDPASLTLSKAQVEALGGAPQSIITRYGTLELNGYNLGGDGVITLDYRYTLVNAPEVSGDHTSDTFAITATDRGGDDHSQNLSIRIVDDVPQASADTDSVAAGQYSAETGNVISGAGTTSGSSSADVQGADGATITAIASDNVPANDATNDDGTLTIQGQYGTLVIEPSGDYSYTRAAGTPGGVDDVFSYTLTDADGDPATATLTISIADATPTIGGLTPQADGGELTFHERYLADGTTPDDDELTKTGDFTITSPDGVKSLVIDGVTVIADGALTSSLTVSTGLGNTLTITGYDPDTGVVTYSYALGDNQTHTQPSDNTELFENIALVLTDQDDQTASGTLGVRIVDDVPVVTDDAGELGSVTVDETTLGTPATDSDFVADVFGVNYGADGAASSNPLVYALNVASAGVVAGVIDTANGQGVYLYKVGHDIVGRVGNGGSADPAGAEAFRIEIDATTGAVTLTQSRPLSHPDADDHDDPLSLASDAITLTATATDGDGDATTSTAVDVGGRFTFLDDGPGISAAPTGATIDEANLANGSEPDVPLTSVSHSLNVQFGADGAGDVQFTGDTSAALEGLGLESNGEGLTYDITGGGHTLTAYRGDVADGIPVFTVVIINPGTTPAYQFTLLRPLDHIDGTGAPIDDIALDFVGILVTDRDGDTVETQFTVTVLDDTPDDTQPKQVTIDEDSTAAVPANTFNTNADATGSNTTIGYGDNGTMAPAHGTAMVNPDGTITYVPHGNYSGTDTFTYTTVTDNETKTFTVEVTVDPVADAPDMDGDGPSTGGDVVLTAVDTPEDTAVTLGLKAPIVTDAFDGNGASAGDASEKLSLVTLSGVPAGARLLAELDGASAAIDFTASGGDIGILLSDGDHMTGLSGQTLTMTRAQFEQLQLLPPTESHQNISLTVRVTSYEVDDAGARAQVGGVDVPGAEAIATLAVYVQAVTDPIDLRIHDGVDYVDADTSGSAVTLPSFEEDTSIDLKDYLQITLDEATDGNTGADVDGSEERWFEVTGLPVGWAVNDITITAEDQVVRVDIANGYNGVSPTLPDIIIEPPKDFSGDLDDVRVTLHAQDRDSDGVGSGATTGAPVSDTVHLNLRVDPVAGDVEVEGASGLEDTAIAFLGGIAVTDTSTGASGEIITGVSFRVPAGWTVSADGASWTHATLGTWTVSVPANTADWSLSVDTATGSYTLAGAAGFDLKPILDAFTATPPAHSSRDLTLQDVTVTTVDSNTVGGTSVTSVPATTSPVTLLIEVTPVAEQEDADTADPGGNDVTHNDDHTYMAPGEEDSWFVLGQEGVFNLKTGWANEDGDEETYALLTPKLIFGDSLAEAGGSQFRYSTNGDTTDAGGEWTTLTYDGSNPVEIPMEYLDTLQFKAANNFSGKFEIDVRIRTVDYDDDNEGDGTPSVYTSDDVVATLDNILILPVADQVTLAVHGLAKGDEDTRIPLTIEPRSDDPSETYTVVIKDIPAGAKLFYGDDPDTALELTIVGDTATIENFDSGTLLTVRPPVDGNTDFTLTVEARSVDTMPNLDNPAEPYVRESPIETKNIQVQVKGVADGFDLQTESNKTYTESAVDGAMNNRVPLSELITGHTPRDTDGSETLNLKITLPAGFSLEGGTWLGDAWLLDASQLATASIRVPEHFSGEVIVGVAVISTEIDGHSISEPTSVTFTITPEVEKTMQDSSALLEDTRGQVQFAIPGGGDTKETLTSVWVDVDDVASGSADYTLYYGSSGSMTLAEAANDPGVADVVLDDGWYKLSGSAIGNVYAQGAANSTGSHDFGVQYTIINTASEGPATDTSTISDTHTLNIAPATDPATLIITGITSSNADNADINDTAVEVTGNTTLTIDFQLTKNPDANAGGARDHDGSERLTGLVIEGVPQGVTIVGASYIGNVPGGGAGSENTGRWLLPIDQAIDQAADGTTFSIEFELLAAADILAGLNDTLTVTAITQDGSAEEVSASASWTLTTPADTSDFEDTDVSATEPVEIVGWTVDNMAAPGVEDAGFQLGSVVQGSLDGSGPFAITITGFTGGSIEGMTETMVNGEPTWTLYGSGDSAGLQALLDSIGITPPGDRNDNGSTPWSFDVTLTTYAPNGERNVVTQSVTPPLAPATDPAAVTVTTNGVTEGDAVTFTVKVAPGVDGEFSRVVDGKLYLRLNEAGGLASGSLTGPDGELDLQAVAGVDGLPDGDYYIIEDVGFGDEVILTYQGGEHAAGQVSLTAGFLTREEGADVSDIRPGFGSVTAVVAPENSGIDFTDENGVSIDALVATGTEDQRVELRVSGALNDQDGSEELLAAFLRHVPTDFLVFVGSDADSAKLANNAGGGIWSIPLTGGALPAYIAVQPPRNWSGTASDLELVVQASDQGLASEDFTLPVTLEVAPVADGISISPTLTFGTEGNIIPINLNAAMPDNDGSELATLAFQGLGKYAAFYAGATLLDADSGVTVTYVEATDTHTVSGLTPQQVNTLGFVQAAGSVAGTVQVTAYTVDGTDSTEGAPSSGSFEVAIAAKPATGGHDVLLYGGAPIDGLGGDDTIQLRFGESLSGDELAGSLSNIEIIDMSGAGQNSIVGLGIEDVLGMTDSRNTLRILGDESDTITLDAGWGTGVVDGDYVLYSVTQGAETIRLEVASVLVD